MKVKGVICVFFVCSVFERARCLLLLFFMDVFCLCSKILQKPWPQRVGIILLG